jgi:hypothetical protein
LRTSPLSQWNLTANGYDGILDEVSLYDYALTSTQVQTHYATGSSVGVVIASGSGVESYAGTDARTGTLTASAGYAGTVMADSPAGYWRLGEPSGTTALDSSGLGRNGTYTTWDQPVQLGQPGALASDGDKAVTFGLASWCETPWVAAVPGSARTYETWLNPDTLYDLESLFSGSQGAGVSGGDVYCRLRGPAGGPMDLEFYPDYNLGGQSWSSVITLGVWKHVVITYDDTTRVAELFLNGVSQGAKTCGGSFQTSNRGFDFGGRAASQTFLGRMDEFAVYEYVLSSSRIATHYAVGTLGVESNANTDSTNATATAGGSGVESYVYSDSATSVVTASGSGSESYAYPDSGSGTVTASGTGTQSYASTDSSSGTLTLSGSKVESSVYNDFPPTVSNPSFETDLSGWTQTTAGATAVTYARENGWAQDGSWSLHMKGTGGLTGTAYSVGAQATTGIAGIRLLPSTPYTLGVWVNPISAMTTTNAVRLAIFWYTATGTAASTASNVSGYLPQNGIERLTTTFTSPADAAFGAPRLYLYWSTAAPSNTTLDAYFDAVTFGTDSFTLTGTGIESRGGLTMRIITVI